MDKFVCNAPAAHARMHAWVIVCMLLLCTGVPWDWHYILAVRCGSDGGQRRAVSAPVEGFDQLETGGHEYPGGSTQEDGCFAILVPQGIRMANRFTSF